MHEVEDGAQDGAQGGAGVPTVLPPQPAPAPAPLVGRYRIDASYEGGALATSVPWQSGLGLGLVADMGSWARLALRLSTLLAWQSGDPPVTWRHRLRAGAGVRLGLSRGVQWDLLAGGGVEAAQWRSTQSARKGVRLLGLATLDTHLRVVLKGRWELVTGVGATAVLNRFDFVQCSATAGECDASRVLLRPWRIRPEARLGVGVHF